MDGSGAEAHGSHWQATHERIEVNETAERPEVATEVVEAAAPASAIAEYNVTAVALAELRQRLAGKTYDLRTTAGDKEARGDRLELTRLLSALETKRTELKAPVLDRGRLLDAEAKRISAELEALRQPIDAAIKADEQRREQERQARAAAEAQRVAAIRARITALSQTPMRVAGKSAEVIAAMLTVLSRLEIDATFAEFTQEAVELRAEVLTQIGEMHAATLLQEQEAARVKAESERLARVDHFGRKVHELRSLSIGMASKSVEAIQDGIDQLERMEVNESALGEFADQAKDVLAAVLGELKVMRADAVERESIAAEQAAEAQRLAVERAAVERAAPVVVPVVAPVAAAAPLPAAVAPAAAPADDGKRIRLGDLCAEVGDGFSMTEAFVRSLGIEKAGTDKRAVLYTMAQRQEIFDALGTKLLGMSA